MFGRGMNIVLEVDTARHTFILREAPQQQAHDKIGFSDRDSVKVTQMSSVARHRLAKLSRYIVHSTISTHSIAYSSVSETHAMVISEGFRSSPVADSSLHTPMDPIMGANPPPVRRYILRFVRICR